MKLSRLFHFFAALALALLGSSCQTHPQRTAATGALIGAGTGALIGSASGNAGRGALIGAAAGGVAGGVYGRQQVRRHAVYAPGYAFYGPYSRPRYYHPAYVYPSNLRPYRPHRPVPFYMSPRPYRYYY